MVTMLLAVYLPGLPGPFILDDHVNLAPIWNWLAGGTDGWTAITQNASGPSGRPLAYLTLLANAAAGGTSALGFKLVNLALHLGATALAWHVLRQVASKNTEVWPKGMVLIALAIWAVHPMQVSTVLYVVQRMAILGAIALLGTVAIYLKARPLLESDPRRARLALFVGIPVVVAVGVLAKETVLLAPLMCGAVEVTLFRRAAKRAEVRWFFAAFLWLPLAVGLLALLVDPLRLQAGYAGREFTLAQRLLTQPRILAEYAADFFLPFHWGLYRDGYPLSTGLWAPPSTLAALGAGAAAIAAALRLRARKPAFCLGVLWFVFGHALEAGPFALEMYFEHRNYLPSLGLIIAVAGLFAPHSERAGGAGMTLAIALVLGLAALTFMRALTWRSLDAILATEGPPAGEISRRLQVDLAIRAFERGDDAQREAALAPLDHDTPGNAAAAAAWRAIFACDSNQPVSTAMREALSSRVPAVVTHSHLSWIALLARRVEADRCMGLNRAQLIPVIDAWLALAPQVSPHARTQLHEVRQRLESAGTQQP